ncbi:hypothetical protein SELMODRAFT_72031, partial [Selaginella moellendorffii]
NVLTWSSLMSAYAQAGQMPQAENLFEHMPERNLVSWSTMISGFAENGNLENARCCFDSMPEHTQAAPGGLPERARPQTHIGRVPQCCAFFRSMQQDFGVAPLAEHFLCVVDLLGKAGHLERAEELVEIMPYVPHAKTW